MKKKISLVILLLFGFFLLHAQFDLNNKLYTVVPPSPDASSLGKFGSIPVNYSTGIPQIDVPIYTIKAHGLTMPISISYHAGGIKVEEQASWVGLGWALNAGGVVTRSMEGLPDENEFGYFNQTFDMNSILSSPLDSQQIYVGRINNNELDLQPDDYYFNFNGKSGRFFVDKNGNAKIIPLNLNIKINRVMTGSNLTGWQIIDEQGNTYYFRKEETSQVVTSLLDRSHVPPLPAYPSSWYLDQVITSLNDTINFNYQAYSVSYYTRQMAFRYYLEASTFGTGCTDNEGEKSNFNQVTISGKRISEIDFSGGKVVFTKTDTTRTDITGDYALQSITVFNPHNDLVQQCNFSYSYFNSAVLPPLALPPSFTTTRLRLDSLAMDTTAAPERYKFSYVGGNLPSTFSYAQDHWGFFNGQDNVNLIPLAQVDGSQATDRSINSDLAQTGTLQRITYPTGGMSDFFYENNTATMSSQDYTNFFLSVGPSSEDNLVNYFVEVASDSAGIPQRNRHSDLFFVDPKTISIDQLKDNFNITVFTNNTNSCPSPSKLCIGTISATITCISDPSIPPITHVETLCTYTNGVGTGVLKLDTSQTYALTYLSGDPFCAVILSAQKEVFPAVDSGQLTVPVGGLRIKRIVSNPIVGNQATKEYYYTNNLAHDPNVTDTLLESGTINGFPHYDYNAGYGLQFTVDPNGDQGGGSCIYTVMASSSLAPLMSGGSASNYKTVQENAVSGNTRLKSVYSYTTAADFPDIINYAYPYTLLLSNAYLRGLLTSESNYTSSEGTYNLLTRKDYQYQFLKDTSIPGMKLACQGQFFNETDPGLSGCVIPIFNTYAQSTEWLSKVKERSVEYDQNSDSTVATTSYFYDNPLHQFPTRIRTTNSKGDTVTHYLKYPLDFSGLTGSSQLTLGLMNLQSRNVVSPVIEKYIELKNQDGSNARVVNSSFTSYSPLIASPDTLWSTELSAPTHSFSPAAVTGGAVVKSSLYLPQVAISKYDPFGNVVQQKKIHGMDNSYIWDYNHQYPIAEVKAADSNSIAYTSFEADGTGNWTIGTGARDTTAAITGSSSFNLTGTITKSGLTSGATYIVSYWTENRSSFSITGTISGYPVKGKTVLINNQNWTLYVHKVTGQTTISVTGSGHIDELRLYPATAQMTTYTYAPLIGMTSQCDIGNRVTYYEYDGLARLKRVRDQDYNILKTYEYQYQASGGCGDGCTVLAMQTLAGTNTLSYPVGVFDINGALVGNATTSSNYISLWNSDTADARVGTLAAGKDSMHFNFTVNSGQTIPAAVTGCRYYQFDLPWTNLDGIFNTAGAYVTFGDGTGMHLAQHFLDTPKVLAPNTSIFRLHDQFDDGLYIEHTYPDTSLKTITIYHNDASERFGLDNGMSPATSLTKVRNVRGYLPQNMQIFGMSSYQQASALTVAGILNWNSIHSITSWTLNTGDGGINACEHVSFAQDFMKNNQGLQTIGYTYNYYDVSYRDTTFKITRLKSDWNTYFTQLTFLSICDDEWNREDLSALIHLNNFELVAANQKHLNDPTNNPIIPIPTSVTDAAINQIAAGAGQFVSGGTIVIATGGTGRTSASNASANALLAKGWTIYIDGIVQVTQ